MKQHPAKLIKPLASVVACMVFACIAASPLRAQRTTPNQAGTIDGRDLGSREQQISSLEREKQRKRDPKEVLTEINEDLQRLQALNVGIFNATTNKQIDYKLIAESSAEIKKRSARLKVDLASLPSDKNENKHPDLKDLDNGQLQPTLETLNKVIDSFLHNPIFSDVGSPDPQLAAKASHDLNQMITLSDMLRKTAIKLNKTGSKTQ